MSQLNRKEIVEQKESGDEKHLLNSTWTIWGHALKDNNWEIESYKKLYEFNSIEDFWKFFNNVHDFSNFMLFIMRGSILPIYEDEFNKAGGTYQGVVDTKIAKISIITLLCRVIGETLIDAELFDEINGVSIVPKGKNTVINIWARNSEPSLFFNNLKDRYFDLSKVRFKKWKP